MPNKSIAQSSNRSLGETLADPLNKRNNQFEGKSPSNESTGAKHKKSVTTEVGNDKDRKLEQQKKQQSNQTQDVLEQTAQLAEPVNSLENVKGALSDKEAENSHRSLVPVLYTPEIVQPIAKKTGTRFLLFLGISFFFAGLLILKLKPSLNPKEQECRRILQAGEQMLKSGDVAKAKASALQAASTCQGKELEAAKLLKSSVEKETEAQTRCARNFNRIDQLLREHRLISATSVLKEMNDSCAKNAKAKSLQEAIEQAQTDAQLIEESVRRAIEDKSLETATTELEKLEKLNIESRNLEKIRKEIKGLRAASSVPPGDHLKLQRTTTQTQESPPQPTSNAMVKAILGDAEQALAQRKFDAARTFAETARRLDPSNALVQPLLNHIREKELQVLKDETTIR